MFISDFLDICDPVLTFDKFMEGINLEKYLNVIPEYQTGRIRYNPVNMLKTVLFGFMTNGYMMGPSLKPMQISIPGYGKRQQKNQDTNFMKKSQIYLRKSMKGFHEVVLKYRQTQNMFQMN